MIASLFTNHGRSGVFMVLGLVGLLAAASVSVQVTRDRWYHTETRPAEQILYVRSAEAMRRMSLSYDALVGDIYWIRALQHFGRERLSKKQRNYALLYPLLDMTTSMDPRFNVAYRFGSLFLAELPPGGPGRPDQAIALLQKGIKEMPGKWEYYQDTGFVYYFGYKDYEKAAEWFKRGSELKGAPWFLKSLAANTLAKGHDRQASRLMYQVIAETADNDFMKKDAVRRLRQLDAMDGIDALRDAVRRYQARVANAGGGEGRSRPLTWQTLVRAGFLRFVPQDPDGFEFFLDPATGDVRLDPKSPLFPLPTESAEAPPVK
jgi:tetratricopeptide (TPR) repeat protein